MLDTDELIIVEARNGLAGRRVRDREREEVRGSGRVGVSPRRCGRLPRSDGGRRKGSASSTYKMKEILFALDILSGEKESSMKYTQYVLIGTG